MPKKLISTIIPFYNRQNLVMRALQSVYIQTYSTYEIILIDDGSTEKIDDLLDEVRNNNKIIYKRLEKNSGVSVARNLGIELSKGDYIAFLDSDDEWIKEKLETQLDFMLTNNALITHSSYKIVSKNHAEEQIINSGRNNYRLPYMAFNCKIATPTVMINKQALGNVRFVNEVRFGEDIVFWCELSKIYGPIQGIDLALTKVHIRPDSAAKGYISQKEAFKAIRKYCLSDRIMINLAHRIYTSLRLLFKKLIISARLKI